MSKTKEVGYEWNDSKTWWNGLDSLFQDNLGKKYFPFFNYSELSDFNIETICIEELQAKNERLTTTLSLIRPLAFADHSSVEYNMEEIRKVLNAYGELPKSEGAS